MKYHSMVANKTRDHRSHIPARAMQSNEHACAHTMYYTIREISQVTLFGSVRCDMQYHTR